MRQKSVFSTRKKTVFCLHNKLNYRAFFRAVHNVTSKEGKFVYMQLPYDDDLSQSNSTVHSKHVMENYNNKLKM